MKRKPIEFPLTSTALQFAREHSIGGTFKYRSYENAELVSSKQLTTFSDHRLPLDSPDHISLPDYVAYLESYIDEFDLWKYINLGCRVDDVETSNDADSKFRHRVTFSKQTATTEDINTKGSYECSHLAICTGLHVEPNLPQIPGIEHLRGRAFHSSEYNSRSQLEGFDVMILGCGETAMVSFRVSFLSTCSLTTVRTLLTKPSKLLLNQ